MFRSSREEAGGIYRCLAKLNLPTSDEIFSSPCVITTGSPRRTMKIDGGNCGNAYKKAATVAIS